MSSAGEQGKVCVKKRKVAVENLEVIGVFEKDL